MQEESKQASSKGLTLAAGVDGLEQRLIGERDAAEQRLADAIAVSLTLSASTNMLSNQLEETESSLDELVKRLDQEQAQSGQHAPLADSTF